jgi:integrase
MPKKLDRFVHREKTRHGNYVYYYRVGKGSRTRLPAPNDPAYEQAYQLARQGVALAPKKVYGTNSIAWLISQYVRSGDYAEYSTQTRKQRGYIYQEIEKSHGDKPYRGITRRTIANGKESRIDRPNQARMFLDAMRGLFKWAYLNGYVKEDPTIGVSNPKRSNKVGFEPWTMDDVDKYERFYSAPCKERVWLHVLLYLGLRKGDAVLAGKQHVKNELFSLNTEKTKTMMHRVMHPILIETLETCPTGDLHFIIGSEGNPLNKDTFGNYFRKSAQKAGIFKPLHGIRKLSATIAAEQGLTVAELEALFGWTGGGMAQHYTKSADRKRLAISAAGKMANKDSPHPIHNPLTSNKKVK